MQAQWVIWVWKQRSWLKSVWKEEETLKGSVREIGLERVRGRVRGRKRERERERERERGLKSMNVWRTANLSWQRDTKFAFSDISSFYAILGNQNHTKKKI